MLLLTVKYAKTRSTSEIFNKMPTIERYGASINLALYHDSPSLSLSPTQLVRAYVFGLVVLRWLSAPPTF